MKKYTIIISLFLVTALITSSCKEYLEIPPEVDLSEQEIFGNYENFQGFQDKLIHHLVDYNFHGFNVTNSIGGECLGNNGSAVFRGNNGDYASMVEGTGRSIWARGQISFDSGLYYTMWENIRLANVCLQKLEEGLFNDTADPMYQAHYNWLKGQALFFRAYYYYEFVRAFGPVPYIDRVLSAEEQDMVRHWTYEKNGKTYNDVQAVFEKIVDDLDAAAELLPARYPQPNLNWGRPTALAALGFKAKALQHSASPLFNEQATGDVNYNKELLDRCAKACQETIDLAKSLTASQDPQLGMPLVDADGLTTWSDMRTVFATWTGEQPGTEEVLFHRPVGVFGAKPTWYFHARVYGVPQLIGFWAGSQASQNYLDKFEMTDGSRFKSEYDTDPAQAWDNRDPRFDFNFYTHGDKVDNKTCDFSEAGMKKNQYNSNCIRKFQVDNLTKQNYGQYTYSTPLLRLADIYLTYAEAVYESTGSYSSVPAGLNMSAEQAVNIVRSRAGMPDVATTLPFYENNTLPGTIELSSDPAFRLLYRNERAVELSFEGNYWFDIRRWKRATLKDGVQLQKLLFDVDNKKEVIVSSIRRVDVKPYVFKDQHYWMPFQPSLTKFSTDWEQNPGW